MTNSKPARLVSFILALCFGLTLAACDALFALTGPTSELTVQVQLDQMRADADAAQVMDETVDVLTSRLEGAGLRVTGVERKGRDVIKFTTVGQGAPEAMEAAIGQKGELSFLLEDEAALPENTDQGFANPGSKVLPYAEFDENIAVRRLGGISGRHIVQARAGPSSYSDEAVINIQFDEEGAKQFARLSTDNVGKRFAIVLDDVVLSAPVFQEPILGGSAQISGNFTEESANRLAVILQSGSLPVDVALIEMRVEGPEF